MIFYYDSSITGFSITGQLPFQIDRKYVIRFPYIYMIYIYNIYIYNN